MVMSNADITFFAAAGDDQTDDPSVSCFANAGSVYTRELLTGFVVYAGIAFFNDP